jgi:endoglucanase
MLNVVDPANNTVFEAHQYLDSDSSGGSSTCMSTTIGSERLAPFISWLRANKKKGFLGEFAGADNPTCQAAIADMLQTIMASADVLVGWTWWAGGPWWGNYMFTLDPSGGQDRPQMAWLAPFLG